MTIPARYTLTEAHFEIARLEARIAELELERSENLSIVMDSERDRLEARIAELQGERDDNATCRDQWIIMAGTKQERTEAAEARCERLEGALRDIARGCSNWSPDFSLGLIEKKARAALAEEPYADVPGAGQRGC